MSWERQLGFYCGIIGFFVGNIVAYTIVYTYVVPILLLCVVSIFGLLHYVQRRLFFVYCGFFLCFTVFGIVRTQLHTQNQLDNPMDVLVGFESTIETWVCEEPDVREFNIRLTLCHDASNTKSLAKTTLYPTYYYGDTVTGTLQYPVGFTGDTERFFDYKNFLLQSGIRYIIDYPYIDKTEKFNGNIIKHTLLSLKHDFINRLHMQLPEPHSSFMAGLLVGAKSSMGSELLDDFRTTGVIHIVVLSGFNITIIVWAIMSLLAFFGMVISSIVGSIAILFFAIMTGAGATVIRASLMAFLVILARLTGNNALVIRMLFLSGFLMVLVNPMLLLYSPSFQLSFMATFGLITLSPVIAKHLHFVPNPTWAQIRDLLSATIATQIMVTPLLLYMMGTFPTYSLFTNFLVLATIPYVMLIGFIAIILSYISYTAALPAAVLSYYILGYNLWIVDVFANLPAASFSVPPFSIWYVVASYTALAVIAGCINRTWLWTGLQNMWNSDIKKQNLF